MAGAKWQLARLLGARAIMRDRVADHQPALADLTGVAVLGLRQRRATNGTMCGAANVSRSSWQITSSLLQTMLWNARFGGVHQLDRELHRLALQTAPDGLLQRADAGHRVEVVLGRWDHRSEHLCCETMRMPVVSARRAATIAPAVRANRRG